VYAAVVAAPRPFTPRLTEEGDMHGATVAAVLAARAARAGGLEEGHELRLVAPNSLAPLWALPMEAGESVLTLCPLPLRNSASGDIRPTLVLGTGFLGGEDAPCRGRCLLVEPGGPAGAAPPPALLHARAFKTAVTAAAPLEGLHRGYVLLALGPKVGVHAWDGKELTCVAFFDAPVYSVALSSVRNFVLLGDALKGLFFLRWKDSAQEKALTQLAKTFEPLDYVAGELLLDGNSLALLGCDAAGGLHLYAFAPGAVEAWMGAKLLPRARFHTARTVTRALRLPCAGAGGRSGILLATAEGALLAVTPMDEGAFAPLTRLTAIQALALPHPAGLNPAAHRAPRERPGRSAKAPAPSSLLDLPLLARFAGAPWGAQQALAERVDAPRAGLLKAVEEARALTEWFV